MTQAVVTETQQFNFPAGASRLIYPHTYTELTGQDITQAAVLLSIGTAREPGAWVTPDISTSGTILASDWLAQNPRLKYHLTVPGSTLLTYVTAQIALPSVDFPGLVTSDRYWAWMSINFAGQTIPNRGANISIIAA